MVPVDGSSLLERRWRIEGVIVQSRVLDRRVEDEARSWARGCRRMASPRCWTGSIYSGTWADMANPRETV